MKQLIKLLILSSMFLAGMANAIPTLQTYVVDSTAGDDGSFDEDTWFGESGDFDLWFIGAYGPNDLSIHDGQLIFTVAEGESLFIQIGGVSADFSVTMYDDLAGLEAFLNVNFNNHSPLGRATGEVDLYVLDLNLFMSLLGDFEQGTGGLPDCNADVAGTTSCTFASNAIGEIIALSISLSGSAEWAHIDGIAWVTTETGMQIVSTWDINPGSHDSTVAIPEPATAALLGLGLIGFGLARRRKLK